MKNDSLKNVSTRTRCVAEILFHAAHRHIDEQDGFVAHSSTLDEAANQLFGASMMTDFGSDDQAWLTYLYSVANGLARSAQSTGAVRKVLPDKWYPSNQMCFAKVHLWQTKEAS